MSPDLGLTQEQVLIETRISVITPLPSAMVA
jgi:hypothetical protein